MPSVEALRIVSELSGISELVHTARAAAAGGRCYDGPRRREEGKACLQGRVGCLARANKRAVPEPNHSSRRRSMAAERDTGGNTGGIGLGGILVIVGIVLMIVWSFWVGLIVTLVGLIAFGGFAKGKWY
jgi:hypothetical protein